MNAIAVDRRKPESAGGLSRETPLRGRKTPQKTPDGNREHAKARLSTRHFYFAENPTFLLWLDTGGPKSGVDYLAALLDSSFPWCTNENVLIQLDASRSRREFADRVFGTLIHTKRRVILACIRSAS